MLPKEFRVYPHRDSTVQCVNLETVDDPVLHFSLRKHRDAVQTSEYIFVFVCIRFFFSFILSFSSLFSIKSVIPENKCKDLILRLRNSNTQISSLKYPQLCYESHGIMLLTVS